ncbi:MAG: right-handed parallel beta-helix repeat-containing protein [Chitinispirillaceae bacterium]|nr:right-handed parallel beta-helix repeat-containing protein [Chitinispirillaceae bacterium]
MKRFLALLLLAVAALHVQAGTKIVVPKEAKKISDALEKAEAGDTVYVLKGLYKESITLRDGIALIGESVTETVIKGKKRKPVVKGADNALLRNFTIQNGEKGILCENVSMVIEHNYVCNNKGSGIHCLVTLPLIRNNVIFRNGWTGIFCETVKSLNTLVEHNVIGENGYSGILLAGNSEVIVQNNVFLRNKQFGIWVNDGARRSRIIYNNFFLNRSLHNHYAQVDNTNIAIDPGYVKGTGAFSVTDIFSSRASVLKGKGKDGAAIGLISESEMMLLGKDADKDGVTGENDLCPSLEEDQDGFQDEDGCPDFDNDRDGLYDSQDKCPDQAEDADNFEDQDGCPDYDNDGDGIPDSVDVCPNNPETINSYKDDDGCPDEAPAGGGEQGMKTPVPAKNAGAAVADAAAADTKQQKTADTGKQTMPKPQSKPNAAGDKKASAPKR